MINSNLNNGQRRSVENNLGKNVNVDLLGTTYSLNVHGGVIFAEEFRYVMHKAKRPRKPFNSEASVHENIGYGYYFVNPMHIIL
jgi:hypothetical protein